MVKETNLYARNRITNMRNSGEMSRFSRMSKWVVVTRRNETLHCCHYQHGPAYLIKITIKITGQHVNPKRIDFILKQWA